MDTGTGGSRLGHGPASVSPHGGGGGGPVTHRGAPAAGSSVGCRQQPPPLPGPFRRRCDPRSGPAVPAAAAKGPGRGEPAPPSRSSARLPPCEVRRPPRRAPGPPCRSGEDAAGEAPHLAGLLGAGDGVPSLCRVKEAIFLAEIYVIYVFPPLPAPFRQCLALLGALASTCSVQAEPQHLGENRTLRLGYSGVFLGVDFLKIIFILVFLRGFGVGFFFFFGAILAGYVQNGSLS